MGNLINIAFIGGTHGAFLRHLIDKYSSKTPPITNLPFTDNGTSHNSDHSGLVEAYHPSAIGWKNKQEPHVIIKFDKEDISYIVRLIYSRAADVNIDWNKDYISLPDVWYEWIDKIKLEKLYGHKLNKDDAVPKFIFRDFFKFSFLDLDRHEILYELNYMLNNDLKNVHHVDFNDFYDGDKLYEMLLTIDSKFDLQMVIDKKELQEIHSLFLNKLPLHTTRGRAEEIFQAVLSEKTLEIDLDCIEQGWVNAQIEKHFDFILMPNTNEYFKTSMDIKKYIEWYPKHYKAMNPNLPTFNNMPNPFYLHKKVGKNR